MHVLNNLETFNFEKYYLQCSISFSGLYLAYNIPSSVNIPIWALSSVTPYSKRLIISSGTPYSSKYVISSSRWSGFIIMLAPAV